MDAAETRAANKALKVLLAFTKLAEEEDREFPLRAARLFLEVVLNPGKSQTDLIRTLRLDPSSTSRNLSLLQELTWNKKEGFGLIEASPDHAVSSVVKVIRLTRSGEKFLKTILEAVES